MQVKSISQILQSSTVRIETFTDDGGLVSTGFIYEYRAADNTYPFLVTTRHGIAGAGNGRITLVPEERGKPALGKGYTLDIDNFEQLWYGHPDETVDLAVTPFVPFVKHVEESGVPVAFTSLAEELLWYGEHEAEASPLEEVVFVGYPSGISDPLHMLPVMSRGITAIPPGLDYGDKRLLLINASLYPGCSGSPVFLIRRDRLLAGDKAAPTTCRLLGCLVSGYDMGQGGEPGLRPLGELFDGGAPPGAFAGVMKASLFVELIEAYLKEKGFI